MPQHVAVIGVGMVGLSTAWFLQEHGMRVTDRDRDHVAAGSSWGNAGWLTPVLTAPLPEPAVLKYGVRAVMSPSSPVYVPLRANPRLLRFLAGFARHSSVRKWGMGMRAYAPMNRRALDAFDELVESDVAAPTRAAGPFLACFRSPTENKGLVEELEHIRAAGQDVKFDVLTGDEARAEEPAPSTQVGSAVRLHGQRYINPPAFTSALATAVRARGGEIIEATAVTEILPRWAGVRLVTHDSGSVTSVKAQLGVSSQYDAVVIANGAWLSSMARKFGVPRIVQAGRGYSFSVAAEHVPAGPVYFPTQRVACTPLDTAEGPRLCVAGMMEFRSPDVALDRRRIRAIVNAARPMLEGVDLENRTDEWVGSRPCTADGLPLIGGTTAPGVFVAGGHGMWGIALGPLTGKLLVQRTPPGSRPPSLSSSTLCDERQAHAHQHRCHPSAASGSSGRRSSCVTPPVDARQRNPSGDLGGGNGHGGRRPRRCLGRPARPLRTWTRAVPGMRRARARWDDVHGSGGATKPAASGLGRNETSAGDDRRA